jgi:hypothetical protein
VQVWQGKNQEIAKISRKSDPQFFPQKARGNVYAAQALLERLNAFRC